MFKNVADEVWAFDCEWVPDPSAGRLLYKLPDDMPDREAVGEMWRQGGATEHEPQPFLKLILSRVVSIAALRRKTESDGSIRLSLMSLPNLKKSDGSDREREILSTFLNAIGQHKPQLVGFNSHSADLTIMIQRAITNGISAPEFCKRPDKPWEGLDYFARNTEAHIDLKEIIGSFGKGTPSLHELASLSGIPGKMETDGAGVAEMWLRGDIKGIVAYNELDALTTYLVWLRAAHFAGFFSAEQYEVEQRQLRCYIKHLAEDEAGYEHMQNYLGEWDRLQALTRNPPLHMR